MYAFDIPLKLNYEVNVNPNLFEALTHFNHWLNKYVPSEKQQKINLYDICILNAYCFPDASVQQLLGFTQTMTLLLVCDDLVLKQMESYEKAVEFANKASNETSSKTSYGSLGLQALKMFNGEQLSPYQKERFCKALKNCFDKTSSWSSTQELDVTILRKQNATEILFLFAEMISNCDMSPFVDDALYQSFREEIDNLLTITDTIFSFNQKELQKEKKNEQDYEDELDPDLRSELKQDTSIEEQEKLNETVKQFNHLLPLWEKTCNQLTEQFPGNRQIPALIKCVKQIIVGNVNWGLHSLCFDDVKGCEMFFDDN